MIMRYGSVYLITNLVNDKKYVGQTIFLVEERWKSHKKATNPSSAIQRAIRKYGKDNFRFEELCSCINEENLNYCEEYFINIYNTCGKLGYNLTFGGDASKGKFTKEVRNKMSLAKIGKPGNNSKVNQSGSLEIKDSRHAQRLEGESVKTEHNPSTSSRQPSKYEILKKEIIEIYNRSNSSYVVAEKLNLDKSMITLYLKKWGVCHTQGQAASNRNKKRYKLSSEFIENVMILIKTHNISQIARKLQVNPKVIYRALKAEKIV